jgi:plastocyanin
MRGLVAGLLLAFLMLAGCSDSGGDKGSPSASGSGSGQVSAGASASMSGTGGSGSSAGGAVREAALSVASTGAYPVNPGFDPSTASVQAGTLLHVTFSNGDALPIQHNLVFDNGIGKSDSIASGDSVTFDVAVPAKAGDIHFYCSIGDHRDRGMEGTLTVTA